MYVCTYVHTLVVIIATHRSYIHAYVCTYDRFPLRPIGAQMPLSAVVVVVVVVVVVEVVTAAAVTLLSP